jgi:protocatechuate 3,4-dioxygenase beta subunit
MPKLRLWLAAATLILHGNVYAQCVATVANPPGNHYQPIKENKINVGSGFRVSGYVRQVGDCKPLVGAKVGHWQPGAKGKYDDGLRAYLLTDRNGHYSFSTERPGSTPPEIYFMVMAPGYKTLITRWVGDTGRRDRVEVNLIVEPAS